MGYLFRIIFITLTISLFTNCEEKDNNHDVTKYGNWIETSQFDGNKREGAVSFVIGDTAYVGLGYNGSHINHPYFSDLFSNSGSSSWTKQDTFPGAMRQDAFSFSVDGKGYIGCGYHSDSTEQYFSDVWEFDPNKEEHHQWTQIADYPGGKCTELTSFVVEGIAYVAGGVYDSTYFKRDCYEFNSSTKTFKQIEYMTYKRAGAFSFVIGDIAYVGGGYYNDEYVTYFDCFDASAPVGKRWKSKVLRTLYLPANITDTISHYSEPIDFRRRWAVAFSTNGKGYMAAGEKDGFLSDCWEYDPSTDLWTEMNSFEFNMPALQKASAFILKGKPYVMLGKSERGWQDTVWIFDANGLLDETD